VRLLQAFHNLKGRKKRKKTIIQAEYLNLPLTPSGCRSTGLRCMRPDDTAAAVSPLLGYGGRANSRSGSRLNGAQSYTQSKLMKRSKRKNKILQGWLTQRY